MIAKDRLVDEFMQLVKVDSETKHEQEISKLLKQKFEALGLQTSEDDAAQKTGHGAGNLFVIWEATDAKAAVPTIFLLVIWIQFLQA